MKWSRMSLSASVSMVQWKLSLDWYVMWCYGRQSVMKYMRKIKEKLEINFLHFMSCLKESYFVILRFPSKLMMVGYLLFLPFKMSENQSSCCVEYYLLEEVWQKISLLAFWKIFWDFSISSKISILFDLKGHHVKELLFLWQKTTQLTKKNSLESPF